MNDLIEREAAIRAVRGKAFPVAVLRLVPASTRYTELERAARQALDLLATSNVRKLLDAMCCCDPDVGHICFGCATVTELFHALAALDGGEGK